MGNFNAADRHPVAGPKAMYVEPLADAHIIESGIAKAGGEQAFRGGEVVGCRHLEIILAAGHDDRSDPRRLGDRGVIGQHPADRAAMRLQYGMEVKALRRLCAPQQRAVDRFRGYAHR